MSTLTMAEEIAALRAGWQASQDEGLSCLPLPLVLLYGLASVAGSGDPLFDLIDAIEDDTQRIVATISAREIDDEACAGAMAALLARIAVARELRRREIDGDAPAPQLVIATPRDADRAA